jgi:NAD(P)-dependent dehydrogenase (short-subunit alcohol dehydrogenase family)
MSRGGRCQFLAGDVGSEESVRTCVQTGLEKFGTIDVLVNVVGIAAECPADKLELAERIDFPAIRQGLKDDLAAKLAETPMTDDPVAKPARDFAVSLLDGVVDAMVTPDNLLKLVKTGQMGPDGDEAMLTLSPTLRLRTAYVDFNTVKVTVADRQTPNAPLHFVMTRDGFYKWKVTSVHFPF